MEDLRVPKTPTSAEALLAGGLQRRVTLYLTAPEPGRTEFDELQAMLNEGDGFLPALDEESRVMTFLNRTELMVLWVSAALGAGAGAGEDLIPPTEHDVQIALADGRTLGGRISYVLHPDHARLLDFLEEPARFFRIADGDRLGLVNRRRVARVALSGG